MLKCVDEHLDHMNVPGEREQQPQTLLQGESEGPDISETNKLKLMMMMVLLDLIQSPFAKLC